MCIHGADLQALHTSHAHVPKAREKTPNKHTHTNTHREQTQSNQTNKAHVCFLVKPDTARREKEDPQLLLLKNVQRAQVPCKLEAV